MNSSGTQTVTPSNAAADYAEVQRDNNPPIRNVQSSAAEEAEAGQKLVPRPEDVTSFESAAEPDVGGNQRAAGKGPESWGKSIDRDPREQRRRDEYITKGHSDMRRGTEWTHTRSSHPDHSHSADHQ